MMRVPGNPVNRNANRKNTNVGSLRRAQLITTYGPGAIADFPGNCSAVMASIDQWKHDKESFISEPGLENLLDCDGFIEPACTAGEDAPERSLAEIPAWRFPGIGFCNKCGRLGTYKEIGRTEDKRYFCRECRDKRGEDVPLLPSRFVAVCINGHLSDFPYGWWVHRADQSCKDAHGRNLEIAFTGESGGLDSIIIRCRTCGKERSMAGCFDREALKGFACTGHKPWIDDRTCEPCAAIPRAMQRGASGVWFGLTASALTLPSLKARIQRAVSGKWEELKNFAAVNPAPEQWRKFLEAVYAEELKNNMFTVDDLLPEILSRAANPPAGERQYSLQNLYEDEYAILSTHDGQVDEQDKSLFRAVPAGLPPALSPFFSRILLLGRLREVMALYGFRRITPEEVSKDSPEYPGCNLSKGYVPLGKEPVKRLPAVEMLGEGIFLQLREDALQEWERQVGDRYSKMAARLENTNVGCANFSPRYVLLHTLAHLLIRQLTLECGYSGASIRERIYSTCPGGKPMAGILLYTSSTDADGSLGGLVRNGRPENLERIFFNMLREASWCSTDPICAESGGQGLGGLNYAACHACVLLPETSCVMRNCLLDRMAVIGSREDPETGYFHTLLLPGIEDGQAEEEGGRE